MFRIQSKQSVLMTLRQNLHVSEVVVVHSVAAGEPSSAQQRGNARSRDLREAIRFIEEHAADE